MSFDFSVESIAVVGASSDPEKISGRPIKYLQRHRYEGPIYPVNPSHDRIGDLACYDAIEDVPETPDLAMVILPAPLVVDVVEDCFDAGVETVLIVSSGFSETGTDEGIEREARLQELAASADGTIVGPNSQGLIDFTSRLTASFTPALEREELVSGPVSFVTQSGAFGGALTTLLQDSDIGLNKWIATGNEADLGALDIIDGYAADEGTDVAAGYIEAFKDGRRLIETKRTAAGRDLPIVLLKVGDSDKGRAASASHTGKIADESRIYDALFRETGVIAVDDIDLFTAVIDSLLALSELPEGRLGIMSTSGGAGVHIADVAAEQRLDVPDLAPETAAEIREYIPDFGSVLNPVDITGQVVNNPAAFKDTLTAMLGDDNTDTVLLQITNASGDLALEFAEQIADVVESHSTPLFLSWTGGVEKGPALEVFDRIGIPVFENPARCVKTIAAISRFQASKSRLAAAADLPLGPSAVEPAESVTAPRGDLTEHEGKELLAEYGIRVTAAEVVTDPDAAVEAARSIGYPVVCKLLSRDLQHKDRVGGVKLGLNDDEAVREATADLIDLADEQGIALGGISIQHQVPDGLELSMGIISESDFGPLLMLGRGGVDIEQVEDTTFRSIPVAGAQAASMLEELRTVDDDDLSPAQRDAVVEGITALSQLAMENQWITEADVNPLILGDRDLTAVDALILGDE